MRGGRVLDLSPATAAPLRNTTAAAPSANSAAATNIARLGSLGRAHSEHRSTVKNRTLAPGLACASRAARVSDRQAFEIRAERQAIHKLRIQARDCQTGNGVQHQKIDVFEQQTRLGDGFDRYNLQQVERVALIRRGALFPTVRRLAPVGWHAGIARANPGVGEQRFDTHKVWKDEPRPLPRFPLINPVGGIGRGDRQNIDVEPQVGPIPRSCVQQAPLHRPSLSRLPAEYRSGEGTEREQMENKPNGGIIAQLDEAASFGKSLAQPFRNIIFVDCDCFLLL